MAKKKDTQAEQSARFLAAAKAARADQSGRNFAQAMGKITLAKQSRKASKGQVDK
ncbi:MAG: hypothetical protein ABI859_01260 [Pseudomonadota bacterium]